MSSTCTRRMTCRRMRYSLAGVCMEGSRAPHARELLSFVGFRPVASILASTCIDSSWILAKHLILHLPTEARLGGPVQNRWCYPTERMQKTLREKCKNKRRIKASMAEAFTQERRENFVTAHYEAKNRHLHNPKPWYNADEPKKG